MEKRDLTGPLAQFQATSLEKEDMLNLMLSLNELLDEYKREKELLVEEFEEKWNNFKTTLDKKFKCIRLTNTSKVLPKFIDILQKGGLPEPEIGRTVNFKEGFESHAVYEAVFNNATERLYIFGRKNRKVFDKDHWWFYESLKEKISNGFDFKCLFLNPDSPKFILDCAHQDEDFINQLNNCLNNAITTLERNNIEPNLHLKKYKTQRTFEIIIIDDAVLFTPIRFDCQGRTVRLTKSSFTITNIYTSQGKTMLENFIAIWESAENIK